MEVYVGVLKRLLEGPECGELLREVELTMEFDTKAFDKWPRRFWEISSIFQRCRELTLRVQKSGRTV